MLTVTSTVWGLTGTFFWRFQTNSTFSITVPNLKYLYTARRSLFVIDCWVYCWDHMIGPFFNFFFGLWNCCKSLYALWFLLNVIEVAVTSCTNTSTDLLPLCWHVSRAVAACCEVNIARTVSRIISVSQCWVVKDTNASMVIHFWFNINWGCFLVLHECWLLSKFWQLFKCVMLSLGLKSKVGKLGLCYLL